MNNIKLALLLITIANLGNYTLRGMNMTDEKQNTHSGEKRARSPQAASATALPAKKLKHKLAKAASPDNDTEMAAASLSSNSSLLSMTAGSTDSAGMPKKNLEKKESVASSAEEADLKHFAISKIKAESLAIPTEIINEIIALRDGRLAFCYSDGTISIWDLNKKPGPQEVIKLKKPRYSRHPVSKILELSNGRLAAYYSYYLDPFIRIWDLTKQPGQQLVAELIGYHWGHLDELIELRDNRLASCSIGTITIWDLNNKPGKEEALVLKFDRAPASIMELDNNIIAFCLGETIRVWDLTQRKEIAKLEGHKFHVYSIIKLSNNTIASYGADLTIRVWDLTQQSGKEEIAKLEGHTNCIHAIIKLSNNRLASCSVDGTIRIWDLTQRKQIAILKGHTPNYVFSIIELSDNIIASCSTDRTIRIWDLAQKPGKEEVAQLKGHTDYVNKLVKLSGHRFASHSGDNSIRFWGFDETELKALRAGIKEITPAHAS